jgi:hypothetical protein
VKQKKLQRQKKRKLRKKRKLKHLRSVPFTKMVRYKRVHAIQDLMLQEKKPERAVQNQVREEDNKSF